MSLIWFDRKNGKCHRITGSVTVLETISHQLRLVRPALIKHEISHKIFSIPMSLLPMLWQIVILAIALKLPIQICSSIRRVKALLGSRDKTHLVPTLGKK